MQKACDAIFFFVGFLVVMMLLLRRRAGKFLLGGITGRFLLRHFAGLFPSVFLFMGLLSWIWVVYTVSPE